MEEEVGVDAEQEARALPLQEKVLAMTLLLLWMCQ